MEDAQDYNYKDECIVVQKVNQPESVERSVDLKDLQLMYGSSGSPINIKQFS